MVEWMSYPLYYAFDGAMPPQRAGAAHATIYPYGPFPAGDGKTVMLGLQNEREWSAFCKLVLRRPGLAAEQVDRAPRRGPDRQRPHERHARRVETPAAACAWSMDSGRHTDRPDPRLVATRRQRGLGAAHGRRASTRPAHRRHPCRARLERCRHPVAPHRRRRLSRRKLPSASTRRRRRAVMPRSCRSRSPPTTDAPRPWAAS